MQLQNLLTADSIMVISSAIAGIAAIFGLLRAYSRSKMKLKVTPMIAIPVGGTPSHLNFCIEVSNLSSFPVYLTGVGFLLRNSKNKLAVLSPFFVDRSGFPKKLEPRTSATAYFNADDLRGNSAIKCAYAATDCGEMATGSSEALRNFTA